VTEDTPPTPKRRRWRWLVAAVLLTAAVSIVFWKWPSSDPRLVGIWAIVGPAGQQVSRLKLQSNGIGHRTDEGGTTFSFEWRVHGAYLVTGNTSRGQLTEVLNELAWLIRRPGGFIQMRERRAEIIEVGPDTVRLRDRAVLEDMVLQRVAE
jgi:hypothetical protein